MRRPGTADAIACDLGRSRIDCGAVARKIEKVLPMKTELTGTQVRMARAFLRWSITELAETANVGISTVQRIEAADDPAVRDDLDWRASARGESIQAIRETLIRAGITLLPDDGKGVGVRGKARKGRRQ
jgi:hypothetical protein